MAKAKSKKITLEKALVPLEEQPYEVPENWCWIKLGVISSIISKGTTPKGGKSAYVDEGIDFLRVENINDDGTICHDDMMHVTEETHTGFLKRSILEENDILVSIAGTLGKTAIVKNGDLPLNTNQAVAFVRLKDNGEVSREYIRYALFVSSNQVNGPTGEYAQSRYLSTFGEQSGIIFLIDMTNRELYIYSHNEMFRIITRTNAYTITDNVYTYATDGDYYTCASMVYSQVEVLLKGEEISRPMKHAGNLMLAVIFSILLNYWLLRKTSKVKELDMENLLRGSKSNFHMEEPKFLFVTQKRVRMSGGGGGGHGGGSSGGGGGGGGHSF